MANRAAVARRAVHVAFASSLLYYVIPDPLPAVEISRAAGALAFAALVTAVEAWRLRAGVRISLMRDYEMARPAAYYWLGLGCCLALVFFPARFAVLTILGVCLADPAIGIARGTRAKRGASLIGFLVWVTVAAAAILLVPLAVPLSFALLGAAVAVAVEPVRIPVLDDDFTMNLAPLVVLAAIAQVSGL